jgi:leucine dehydrogenase
VQELDHEQVLIRTGERSRLPIVVAVHSTVLGQAVGGVRLWHYDNWTAGLEDALRLSRAMTLKCSLAGLSLGGGKSVIALPLAFELDDGTRRDVLLDLGDAIESLRGAYGAGEDVGTTADDMATIREQTRFVYGLPEATGGSGEPSAPTAIGVHECIVVTSEELFGTRDLAGRTITIIGLGQVGSRLAERLSTDGAKLTVTDTNPAKRQLADRLEADWVAPDAALATRADILVPAALGGIFTRDSVSLLDCSAIVGPANNQLATDDVAGLLDAHGVLWAPDFLVNAGGVIYGADMETGSKNPETALQAVTAVGGTLKEIYGRAARDGVTPLDAAQSVALERVEAARRSRT